MCGQRDIGIPGRDKFNRTAVDNRVEKERNRAGRKSRFFSGGRFLGFLLLPPTAPPISNLGILIYEEEDKGNASCPHYL
jgi:hypothetical protein